MTCAPRGFPSWLVYILPLEFKQFTFPHPGGGEGQDVAGFQPVSSHGLQDKP